MAQSTFSMSQHGRTEAFELQVARGQVPYHTAVNINGYQTAIGTTPIAVWENATAYTFPSSAVTMTVTGTNSDTAQIAINGLDANYNPISETVILNGSTGVTTTNQYFRINSINVVSGTPAATVTVTNGGTTYAKILSGAGRSQMSIYTVPAGCTFLLNRIGVFSNDLSSGTIQNLFQSKTTLNNVTFSIAQVPFIDTVTVNRQYPLAYQATSDIQFQCSTNSGTSAFAVYVEGVLVTNLATAVGY